MKNSTCRVILVRYSPFAMTATIRIGMMCAFGAIAPVAIAAPADAKDVAASTIGGYTVSFSGGG